jgi:hypothetical protein
MVPRSLEEMEWVMRDERMHIMVGLILAAGYALITVGCVPY